MFLCDCWLSPPSHLALYSRWDSAHQILTIVHLLPFRASTTQAQKCWPTEHILYQLILEYYSGLATFNHGLPARLINLVIPLMPNWGHKKFPSSHIFFFGFITWINSTGLWTPILEFVICAKFLLQKISGILIEKKKFAIGNLVRLQASSLNGVIPAISLLDGRHTIKKNPCNACKTMTMCCFHIKVAYTNILTSLSVQAKRLSGGEAAAIKVMIIILMNFRFYLLCQWRSNVIIERIKFSLRKAIVIIIAKNFLGVLFFHFKGDQAWAWGWFHHHPTRDPHDEGNLHQHKLHNLHHQQRNDFHISCPLILNAGPSYPSIDSNNLCCESDDSLFHHWYQQLIILIITITSFCHNS